MKLNSEPKNSRYQICRGFSRRALFRADKKLRRGSLLGDGNARGIAKSHRGSGIISGSETAASFRESSMCVGGCVGVWV